MNTTKSIRGEKGKEKIKNELKLIEEEMKRYHRYRDDKMNCILKNKKKLQGLQNPEMLKIWDESFVNMEISDVQKNIVQDEHSYEYWLKSIRELEEEVRILEEELEKKEKKVKKKFVVA
jgi:uncharacterized small protein (DUF1192 family)